MALNKVWVFAEVDTPGKPTSITLELLTKAREMAGTVEAFYAGADPEGMAGPLGEYGATTVYALDTGDCLIGAPAAAALAPPGAEQLADHEFRVERAAHGQQLARRAEQFGEERVGWRSCAPPPAAP
jgi:electron transfer flavoprotein alpha subunit